MSKLSKSLLWVGVYIMPIWPIIKDLIEYIVMFVNNY